MITDPKMIVGLLEKKKRASATELGTNKQTMDILKEAGLVREDGKIKTGKRGKPPIAYVLADGKTAADAAEVEIEEKRERKSASAETIQSKIDKALKEVKANPSPERCTCVATWRTADKWRLREEKGCKTNWICSMLVRLREKADYPWGEGYYSEFWLRKDNNV